MVTYMQHPKHGKMPAYNPAEIATLEKQGWSRFEFPPVKIAVASEESEEVLAPRRGRPPKER